MNINDLTDKLLGSTPVNAGLKWALNVPVSKKKLAAVIDESGRRQLAAVMLDLNTYDFMRVSRALYDYPMVCQKKVLQEMIRAAKNTEFGKKYGFKEISSITEFREKVPLTTWDDYADYADRLTKGESDILFPGKATFFYRTSGTTAAFKFIPESEREVTARKALVMARKVEMLTISGLGAMHKIFAFFNKSGLDVTEGGIPCGTASGRTSQMYNEKLLRRLAYSPVMVEELEGDALNYSIMRCTLAYDDVTGVLGNNAKMMTTLIEFAKEHAEEIIEDIRKGTNKYPFSDKLKEQEKDALIPNPKRADELTALLKQNRFIPRYYWPKITCASFWLGGSVGVHVEEVRRNLPDDVKFVDVGYGASEAKINIPLKADTPAGPLSLFSCFYEFIPEEGGDPVLINELEDGKNYEIVITTYAGLYRYRLKDMIHVEGFTGKTPNIYFLTKTSDVANLGQEKIPGVMLIEAIKKTAEESGFGIKTAQVYPDPEKMSYVVCIETEKQVDDIASFRKVMDDGLQKELEQYRIYRGKLLNMCGLVLMKEGFLDTLMKKYAKGNATAAQVKIPVVINDMPDGEFILKEDR